MDIETGTRRINCVRDAGACYKYVDKLHVYTRNIQWYCGSFSHLHVWKMVISSEI